MVRPGRPTRGEPLRDTITIGGTTYTEPDLSGATGHPADPSDAHDASAISYDNTASGLTATDVQDAIDEVAASGGGAGGSRAFAFYVGG